MALFAFTLIAVVGAAEPTVVRADDLPGNRVLVPGLSRERLPYAAPGSLEPTLGVAGDVLSCGVDLKEAPDTAIATYRDGPVIEAYITSGVHTFRCVGSSMATLQLAPDAPVLSETGVGFDRSYAGLSAVLNPMNIPGYRLGFYHAENHCGDDFGQTVNMVGIAISRNGGQTWTNRSPVIGPSSQGSPCNGGFTGVGQPSAIVYEGFVYVFFTDWTPERADSIRVARAPISLASDPAAYRKYDNGEWVSALLGDGTAILSPQNSTEGYAAAAHVTFNDFLASFLMVYETNTGFWLATSRDLIHWSLGPRIWAFEQPQGDKTKGNRWQSYPTLLAADIGSDPTVTKQSNYLYFGQGRRGEKDEVPVERHHMVRVSLAFGPLAVPLPIALPKGGEFLPSPLQSPFAWVCTGDVSTKTDGRVEQLYDSLSDTGVIVALSSGNEVTSILGDYAAGCSAILAANRDTLVTQSVSTAFSSGCIAGCRSVRVVVMDSAGRKILDEWRVR
ncbi:hypothetical protein AYO38_11510 [bacterium SCGC AG-212-C10]|nr:hypothetical protein AYO38_11510 [bacterium SCGC AG-212-C10]